MNTFLEFVTIMESDQVPPGVDPEMWANLSYRKFWLAQNPEYQQQGQTAPAQSPAARALGAQRGIDRPVGSMGIGNIENSIRSYLRGLGSNVESGMVKNLDLETRREIENMVRSGNIKPLRNAGEARMYGGGVHFYQSPQGLAFIVVRPGIAPMSRKFGTY